jgi:hypothetical protein
MYDLAIQILQFALLTAGALVLLTGLIKLFRRSKGRWLWLLTGVALALTYVYLFDPGFFGLFSSDQS